MKDLKEEKQKEPFLKLVQTSSSHEPFEVPFHRLDDKILNSFAYADSCVGDFVKQYQETPLWKIHCLYSFPIIRVHIRIQ